MNEALCEYRIQNAKEKLAAAKVLYENGHYKDSISRSYYAMFSSARALLATKGLDSSKHSGVISLFNQHFVKTEIVDKTSGKKLAIAKDMREDGDYKDFMIVSREEAEMQINEAEKIIEEIEKVLNELKRKKI
ncbi:MAG: HEPN domain-containing protein [bacterium]